MFVQCFAKFNELYRIVSEFIEFIDFADLTENLWSAFGN